MYCKIITIISLSYSFKENYKGISVYFLISEGKAHCSGYEVKVIEYDNKKANC